MTKGIDIAKTDCKKKSLKDGEIFVTRNKEV